MLGMFGTTMFGSTSFITSPFGDGGNIAVLGDPSTHGGTIISTNQDGTFLAASIAVAVNGALHNCPSHGTTPITAVTVKSFHNGKLVITENAIALCGAIITPPDRGITVE